MPKRSQSAIEYLITYGWAVLMLGILIGGLVALGTFNSSQYVTVGSCTISGFYCNAILSANGILFINIRQLTTSSINITSVACGTAASNARFTPVRPEASLAPAENATLDVACYSGTSQFSGSIGDVYHGYIIINYTNTQEDVKLIAKGSILVKVQVAAPVTTSTPTTTSTTTSVLQTISSSTTSTSTSTSSTTSVSFTPVQLMAGQPSPQSQIIYQGGTAIISDSNASGGKPPYSYQWLATGANGDILNATMADRLCGSSAETLHCNFVSTNSTPVGLYRFQVAVQDSRGGIAYSGVVDVNVLARYPIPYGIIYYKPINLVNKQTVATPSPFQQNINLTEGSFLGYISYNDSSANFEYFYANGTIIPAWIESNSSGTLITWVKLAGGIPASSNITIYVGFASKTANLLNKSGTVGIGEAPQLSPTYGEYDNGASVFNFYDNFAGTTINSEWTQVIPSNALITQNNRITISTNQSSSYGGLILTNGYTGIQIFEGYITAVSGIAAGLALQTGKSATSGGYDFDYWSGSVAYGSMEGGMIGNKNPNLQVSIGIDGGAWLSSSSQVWYKNYVATTGSQTSYSLPSTVYPSIGIYQHSSSTSITYQWVRTRAYPPNGVMPTASFGSTVNGAPNLTINYYYVHNVTINATGNPNTDEIEILMNGTLLTGPSTGKLTYVSNNFSVGKYNITARDITTGSQISKILTVYPPVPGIEYYIPIRILNNETKATPAPFQQMINITESTYSSYLAYNNSLANFEYFYSNGTIIPAWIEGNSSGKLITWVKIVGGIPANSQITIYLGFAPKTTNLLSSSGTGGMGEAPQLSPTYGEYDDGANVFIQYGGKSWSSFTFVGGNWITTNGYLQQTATTGSYSGGPAALIESTSYPATGNYILGMAFNYTTVADARVGIIAVATPTTTPDVFGYRFIGQQADNGAGFISFLNDLITWVVSNTYQGAVSTAYTMTITDAGGTWSGNLYSGYTESGTPLTSLAAKTYTADNKEGNNIGYVGISAARFDTANPINVMWFYMRAYPPNGVIPSVSFGAVQTVSSLTAGAPTPSAPTIDSGQSITLTANPSSGTKPYSYQWYTASSSGTCSTSDTAISGATSSTYAASPTSSAYYCYIVTDSESPAKTADSPTGLVTVNPALGTPSISPSSATYDSGQTITLTASASGGTAPYSYQWYNDTTGTPTAISGATSATFTETAGATAQTVKYYVKVTDSATTPESTASATESYIITHNSIPSGINYYVPINLTNSQTTATPAPFQQMINLSESNAIYGSYIAYSGSLANFEYFYSNGTIIPAWIESNSSGKLITWANTISIPASSKITIYLGFAPKTTNLLSSSGTSGIGEAPQLSSTYAQYDDGASVFNNYWNFAGTSLPSSFSTDISGGTITVNNGLTFSQSARTDYTLLQTVSTISEPQVMDAYIPSQSSGNGLRMYESLTNNVGTGTGTYGWGWQGGNQYLFYGGTALISEAVASFPTDVWSFVWSTTGSESGSLAYGSTLSRTDTAATIANYYLVVGLFYAVGQGTVNMQWLRTRAYPPNGVMPTIAFGSVQQFI
jgi:hypothetical protein